MGDECWGLGVEEFWKGVLNMFPQMRTSLTPNTYQPTPIT